MEARLLRLPLPLLLLIASLAHRVEPRCALSNLRGHDLSALQGTWPAGGRFAFDPHDPDSLDPILYNISVCGTLPTRSACTNSSVCFVGVDGNVLSAGKFTDHPVYAQTGSGKQPEFQITYQGDKCRATTRNTTIVFSCGKTLGVPELIQHSDIECHAVITWKTSVACTSTSTSTEARCYTYDSGGYARDLSPLIRTKGALKAIAPSGLKDYRFFVNPCRNIKSKSGDESVPSSCADAALCVVPPNKGTVIKYAVDPLKSALTNQLTTTYYSTSKCSAVTSKNREAVITFICPQSASEIGILVTNNDTCRLSLEWRTEYACRAADYQNSSCVLDHAGVKVDLRTLYNRTGDYKIATNSASKYAYRLNVCGPLKTACADAANTKAPSACQVLDDKTEKTLGISKTMTLYYVNGNVSLQYYQGSRCSSGFRRMTIINFPCSPNAGKGRPTFAYEDYCVYVFTWATSLTCSKRLAAASCVVRHDTHLFDLSRLTRRDGNDVANWQAIDVREKEKFTYLINVCDEIVSTSSSSKCPAHVYGCQIGDAGGRAFGLGTKMTLTVNKDYTLKLNYSGGDACAHSKTSRSAIVTLVCAPGRLVSAPEFVAEMEDCTYEFVWYTAAACPVGTYTGAGDCTVTDSTDGYTFDLTAIRGKAYSLSTSKYAYRFSVCSSLPSSKCSDSTAAACRETNDGKTAVMLGKSSSVLTFHDGALTMKLPGGDTCGNGVTQTTLIQFECDPHSTRGDDGLPDYKLSTSNGDDDCLAERVVRFRTSYACHAQPVPCVAEDAKTGDQYDLSALADPTGNWQADDDRLDGKKPRFRYFINVCRSLNPVHGCSPRASACQTGLPTSNRTHSPAGHNAFNIGVANGPVVIGNGKLVLNYTWTMHDTQKLCHNKHRRKTMIRFSCDKSAKEGSPQFVEETSDCVYVFEWTTQHACPLKPTTSAVDNCSVVASDGYEYNFNALADKDMDYSSFSLDNKYNYSINVCRKLVGACGSTTNAAACQKSTTDVNSAKSLGVTSKKIEVGLKSFAITYAGGDKCSDGSARQVVLQFVCNRATHVSTLTEVAEASHCQYAFTLSTPLACRPAEVPCVASDAAGTYDLSPLAKIDGHWTATGTGDSRSQSFFINVCRSVSGVSGCPAGVGACQLDGAGKYHGTGYVLSSPIVVDGGVVVLRYHNGEYCHHAKLPRVTTIKFSCGVGAGEPVFERETPDCEYVFTWFTQYACPVRVETGSNCVVRDKFRGIDGYTFNLTSLINSGSRSLAMKNSLKLMFRVCRPLEDGCGENRKSGACAECTSGSGCVTESAGTANDKLIYREGELILNYTSGASCGGGNRWTTIHFQCSRTKKGGDQIEALPNPSSCGRALQWFTPLACPPQGEVMDCSYFDPTTRYQYDLTQLALIDYAWRVPAGSRRTYYINVCAPLVSRPHWSRCGYMAGVCEVVTAGTKTTSSVMEAHDLGLADKANFKIYTAHGGDVHVSFDGGEKCPDKKSQKRTIIHFHCQPGSLGNPVLSTVVANCTYLFDWFSYVGCPTNSPPTTGAPRTDSSGKVVSKPPSKPKGDCTVTNPLSARRFDLNSLAKLGDQTVTDDRNNKYVLSVCNAISTKDFVSDANVKTGTGTAQKATNNLYYGAGIANKDLKFLHRNVLALTYVGGTPCHGGKYNRSTIITFVCDKDAGAGKPAFQFESKECSYNFQWKTKYACESLIECSVEKDGEMMDLSVLEGKGNGPNGNWQVDLSEAKSLEGTVYLQLCKPLNAIAGNQCPGGAAACLKTGANTYQNLGEPTQSPVSVPEGIQLVYRSGDENPKCTGSDKRMSTLITFSCKRGQEGKPSPLIFDASSCRYSFLWLTSTVCPTVTSTVAPTEPPSTDCTYKDGISDTFFNLNPLKNANSDFTVFSDKGKFVLNVCQGLRSSSPQCGGSTMVCGPGPTNLGSVTTAKLFYDRAERRLRMEATGISDNYGGSYKSTIYFYCKRSAGVGSPQLEMVSGNRYFFSWNTQYACVPTPGNCMIKAKNGSVYDLQVLQRLNEYWKVNDPKGRESSGGLLINVCSPVKDTAIAEKGCPADAGVCLRTSSGETRSLGSSDAASLKFSADNRVLMLEYTNGHMCDAVKRRRAYTTIQFRCDPHVGLGTKQAILTSVENDCYYVIEWRTIAACPLDIINNNRVSHSCKVSSIDGSTTYDLNQVAPSDVLAKATTGKDSYVYYLTPCRALQSNHGCADKAMVCQTQETGSNVYTIGLSTKIAAWPLPEGGVEMRSNGSTPCHHSNSPASIMKQTIIQFTCPSNENEKEGPVFLYESGQCHYVFLWTTKTVCSIGQIPSTPGPGGGVNQRPSKGGLSGGAVFGIIVLVLGLLSLVLAVYVFVRFPTKRATFFRVIRQCGSGPKTPTYKYSMLKSDDTDEEGDIALETKKAPKEEEEEDDDLLDL